MVWPDVFLLRYESTLRDSKTTIDVGAKANWKLLKNSFKGWRDDAIASKMEHKIDRRIIANSFTYWMIQQRGQLLKRVQDHRILQEALEIWRARLDRIREELNMVCKTLNRGQAAKVLKSSLRLWMRNVAFRDKEYQSALVKALSKKRSLMV